MRKSRIILGGIVVTAAAVTGSAFTAANDFSAVASDNTAGYGQASVSGATVTNIAYAPETADASLLDSVTFTTSSDITGRSATIVIKNSLDAVLASEACGAPTGTVGSQTVTCTLTAVVNIEDIATTGLTVVSS